MKSNDILLVLGPILGASFTIVAEVVRHYLNRSKDNTSKRLLLISEFNKLVISSDGYGEDSSKSEVVQVNSLLMIFEMGLNNGFLTLPAYQTMQLRRYALYLNSYDVAFLDELIKELEKKLPSQYHKKLIRKLSGVITIESPNTGGTIRISPPVK